MILISILVFVLILLGKHLSALVVAGTTILAILYLANINFKYIAYLLIILCTLGSVVILKGSGFRSERLKTYMKFSIFNKAPELEKEKYQHNDDYYQVVESLTALSKGKLFGTGPSGGRAKDDFLPEANTDYIFSIIGEEFGFLGAGLIIILFLMFITQCYKICSQQTDVFKYLLTASLGLYIFITAIVNIGVAMSALPSTGLPLPFISSGGSSMFVNAFAIGIILNISTKRKEF